MLQPGEMEQDISMAKCKNGGAPDPPHASSLKIEMKAHAHAQSMSASSSVKRDQGVQTVRSDMNGVDSTDPASSSSSSYIMTAPNWSDLCRSAAALMRWARLEGHAMLYTSIDQQPHQASSLTRPLPHAPVTYTSISRILAATSVTQLPSILHIDAILSSCSFAPTSVQEATLGIKPPSVLLLTLCDEASTKMNSVDMHDTIKGATLCVELRHSSSQQLRSAASSSASSHTADTKTIKSTTSSSLLLAQWKQHLDSRIRIHHLQPVWDRRRQIMKLADTPDTGQMRSEQQYEACDHHNVLMCGTISICLLMMETLMHACKRASTFCL